MRNVFGEEVKVKVSADFQDALRRVGATEKLIKEINSEPEYCGVYWIITTCLTAIAIGIWLGMVLWLISGEHR